MQSEQKTKKGTVGIESFQGRLRLRLPRHIYDGRQKYLTLGLADTEENFNAAAAKARQIELDILSGNFDPTLVKYQPSTFLYIVSTPEKTPNLIDFWEEYTEFKEKTLSVTTINKGFKQTRNHIKSLPTHNPFDAIKIRDYLLNNLTANAAKRMLVQLKACCDWAIATGRMLGENPFNGLASQIKVAKPGVEQINPFTSAERDLIIAALFEKNRYYHYYTPYVRFLFMTGCRTSEAVGLQWKHISNDCSFITFCEAVVNKHRKDTKTHKSRRFPCNATLQAFLGSIRPESTEPESLVFPSPKGGYIDAHNFLNKAWKGVVGKLQIEYRSQYNIRHTFITFALENGLDAKDVARLVGNSPEIIYKHYAGSNVNYLQVPEF